MKKALKKADEKYNTLKSETQALEKLLYVKCRELYKLRVLSAAILQKRTNLESTLNKCLEETFQTEIQ